MEAIKKKVSLDMWALIFAASIILLVLANTKIPW